LGISEKYLAPLRGETSDPTENHLRRYLAQNGIPNADDASAKTSDETVSEIRYRVTEYCLFAGQEASVFGRCEVGYGPRSPNGYFVICKDEHLPAFTISTKIELRVGRRLHLMALASVSAGIVLIGVSIAGAILLIYPHFA
jgi:hypothetical protein